MKRRILALAALVVISGAQASSSSLQEKANKLVAQGKSLIEQGKAYLAQGTALYNQGKAALPQVKGLYDKYGSFIPSSMREAAGSAINKANAWAGQ